MEPDIFREVVSEALGDRIRKYLDEHQRSEAWLAAAINCSPSRLNKWLNGLNRIPYLATKKICEALKLQRLQQIELFELAGYPLPSWVKGQAIEQYYSEQESKVSNVTRFSSAAAMYDYIVEHMLNADNTIHSFDDVTVGHYGEDLTVIDKEAFRRYQEAKKTICLRPNIAYREIFSFPPSPNFEYAKDILEQRTHAYQMGYYKLGDVLLPPTLAFMVVDSTLIIIGYLTETEEDRYSAVRIAINHEDIGLSFQAYFNALWQSSTKLGRGNDKSLAELERIRQEIDDSKNLSRLHGVSVYDLPLPEGTGEPYRKASGIIKRANKSIWTLWYQPLTHKVHEEERRSEKWIQQRDYYHKLLYEKCQEHKHDRFFYRRILQLPQSEEVRGGLLNENMLTPTMARHCREMLSFMMQNPDVAVIKYAPILMQQTFVIVDERYILWEIDATDPDISTGYMDGVFIFDDIEGRFVQYLQNFFFKVDKHAMAVKGIN